MQRQHLNKTISSNGKGKNPVRPHTFSVYDTSDKFNPVFINVNKRLIWISGWTRGEMLIARREVFKNGSG